MLQNVKSVMLTAGYGIRFFPITKVIGKEFFPFINRPIVDFTLDELRSNVNITNLLCIISHGKPKVLQQYLAKNIELENYYNSYHEKNKSHFSLKKDYFQIKVEYKIQKIKNGTGNALLLAKDYIQNDEFFLLFFPDDIIINPVSQELINLYKKYSASIICFVETSNSQKSSSYGVLELDSLQEESHLFKVKKFTEKPKNAYGKINISIGRYLLKSDVFNILKTKKKDFNKTNPNTHKEFYMTELFQELIHQDQLYAFKIKEEDYYPTGTHLDYIQSITRYAIYHDPFKNEYKDFLKKQLALL